MIDNTSFPSHFESLYPTDSRFEEIKTILEFIKQGNSCQVISLPGVGRSNLLGLLSYNRNIRIKHLGENQKWFHFITTDFSQIRKRPLIDATKFLFLSLVDSLRERKTSPKKSSFAGEDEYEKLSQIFKEALLFKDEFVLFNGFKKAIDLLAIEKELTIVFLFDRFEEYVPMLTTEFFSNLRALRNRAKYRFSIVFSLNRPLEDLIEPALFADYYEFLAGHTIYLPLLDKPGLDFRISYLEKSMGKKIDKKTLDEIINLTGGHGKLTRLALEAALASSNQRLASSKNEEFLLKQKTVLGAMYEIWNSLAPSEQKILATSDKQLVISKEESFYFENIGLIKNEKITIPLFEIFIKSHLTMKQLSNETMIYNENANEIKKGAIVLSDQLTSSEFKLLRFLIQNKDKVINREEIINAVWQDVKSTAGVTDQALDQLIFRLRGKIESDTNDPKHLQTVKGRGLRFSA